eukprot:458246-Pyramimonas_sp.AAC.1
MNARLVRFQKRARVAEQRAIDAKKQTDAMVRSIVSTVPAAKLVLGTPSGSTALGRKRNLESNDFIMAVRACFLPTKGTHVGVNQKRLVTVAAELILDRQKNGVDYAFHCSAHHISDTRKYIHVQCGHAWDEVEVKLSWKPSERYRTLRKAMSIPTLVQRANLSFMM